jgi:hypothetical protein
MVQSNAAGECSGYSDVALGDLSVCQVWRNLRRHGNFLQRRRG